MQASFFPLGNLSKQFTSLLLVQPCVLKIGSGETHACLKQILRTRFIFFLNRIKSSFQEHSMIGNAAMALSTPVTDHTS